MVIVLRIQRASAAKAAEFRGDYLAGPCHVIKMWRPDSKLTIRVKPLTSHQRR